MIAYLAILRRFWWAIPIAGLLVALALTRITLADAKGARDKAIQRAADTQAAFNQTVAAYRHAREQARQSDEMNTIRVGKEQAAINERTIDEYQDRIAALRADFAQRVRAAQAAANPGGGGSAPVSTTGEGPTRIAQASCENRLPPKDALIASEQAIQLDELITWAEQQAAVEVNR